MTPIDSALEIAREMREERDRFYALCSVITDKLGPHPCEGGGTLDPVDCTTYRLAEVLEAALSDFGQLGRLIEHLEEAAKAA